ncbi:MAG TPA: glutamate-cysteine ligase family protein [Legionella sp.]|nr:glutamate-cysteine ligase family protein [Legionella sp.]
MNTTKLPCRITDKWQLISLMEGYCKPKEKWKIGFEYEKFAYNQCNQLPLTYYGTPGIVDLFQGLQQFGWLPLWDNGIITRLQKGLSFISIEPGGQLELSSTPHNNLHQLTNELLTYINELNLISTNKNVSFLSLGFHPTCRLDEIPRMPNPNNRSNIICDYIHESGASNIDVVFRACSTQVSLDFSDEADMVKKYRVSLAIQPILTALFSNSPFRNGKHDGYLSCRNSVWNEINLRREIISSIVFEKDFGFEKYIDHVTALPLFFIYRDGKYIDTKGQTFQDFLKNSLFACSEESPTMEDWENHIGTIWPDVRLKNVLEIRGVDSGPASHVCALSAFCVGAMYNQNALDTIWDIVKKWDSETRKRLRKEVSYNALNTLVENNISVRDIAKEILDIVTSSLNSRREFNHNGNNEAYLLEPLREMIVSGKTLAHTHLEKDVTNLSNFAPF